jgi:hypothetical protein
VALIIDGQEVHKRVTVARVVRLAKAQMFGTEDPGVCIACGKERDGCEPDARKYPCEACGKSEVYGAQELMLYLVA